MGTVVEKSARSPLLVEGRDFSLGLYDWQGRLMEQTEYIPILGYASGTVVREILRYYGPDGIEEGDVILHNDVYSGGNQLSDWRIARPIWAQGVPVGWAVVAAHQADVGGAVAGSYNPHATDLWQEALRITPIKVVERGELRRDVWDLIFGNVRLPVVAEDVRAMIGCTAVGERGLQVLIESYGLRDYLKAIEVILDATEKDARDAISDLRPGRYQGRAIGRHDGLDASREFEILANVTVSSDKISVDFTGSSPQVPGYVNAPLPVTISSVLIVFYMIAGRKLRHNEGVLRCLEVHAPAGSILNPNFPAPTGFGNHLSDQICTALMQALAEAAPDRVTAGWNPLLCSIVSGVNPETSAPFVDLFVNACKGGSGGMQGVDGYDHIGLIASGGAIAAQDPEMIEIIDPVILHQFEYMPDSAGAGEWRGGLGVVTELEFTTDGIELSVFGDGTDPDMGAAGLLGGMNGLVNSLKLVNPRGDVQVPERKDLVRNVKAGTKYMQVAGGGGGFGDPRQRSAETVAMDVKNGVVGVEAALIEYGVAVSADGTVDAIRTSDLRRTRGSVGAREPGAKSTSS
jgi:N-methylhydantoinase B